MSCHGHLSALLCTLLVGYFLVFFKLSTKCEIQSIKQISPSKQTHRETDRETPKHTSGNTGFIREPRSQKCTLPKLDPYDPSILSVIKRAEYNRSIECRQVQPDLFMVDDEGYVQYHQPQYSTYIKTSSINQSLNCSIIDENSGIHHDHHPLESTTFPYKLKRDFAQVECYNNESLIYRELFLNPLPIKGKFQEESDDHFSVLLLVLDGLSVSSLQRYMKKTKEVMQDMHFIEFDATNKIGENTLPNMMALLTGKRVIQEEELMPAELNRDVLFDGMPILFNNFSQNGYVTTMAEDDTDYALFLFRVAGYSKQPTDIFYHSYFKRLLTYQEKDTKCVRNQLLFDHFLDSVKMQFKKHAKQRKFMFMFTCFTHAGDHHASLIDRRVANFFQEAQKNGMLKRTIILFMSDHGPRLLPMLRRTKVGFFEERMPFLSILLPGVFKERHPNIVDNLLLNSKNRRLVTHYDLHETLMDIANSNFHAVQRSMGNRGLSLLYPLPHKRTCVQAGIPLYYCACLEQKWEQLDINETVVILASSLILQKINKELEKEFPGKCANFKLNKVLQAERMQNQRADRTYHFYRIRVGNTVALPEFSVTNITLEMIEKEAVVEGLVELREMSFRTDISSMSRLNIYGNQSHCIHHAVLREFCICLDIL